MRLTVQDLQRWKANSLAVAREQGYDAKILEILDKNCKVIVETAMRPRGIWFGRVAYGAPPQIFIYAQNLSCKRKEEIIDELRSLGVPEPDVSRIKLFLFEISDRLFFELYNQSAMDHVLIGHQYHKHAGHEHNERIAMLTQLAFANLRSGHVGNRVYWNIIAQLVPILRDYYKKDEL